MLCVSFANTSSAFGSPIDLQAAPASIARTRAAVLEGLIDDPNGSIQRQLESAGSLEAHLERARADALRLCGAVVALLR